MKRRTLLIIFVLTSVLTLWQTIKFDVVPTTGSMWVILISYLAFAVKYLLATYVYKSNPTSRTNKFFGIIVYAQAFWDLGKTLMWVSSDPATAFFWGKISYSALVISTVTFPHFLWNYLKRKNFFKKSRTHMWVWYSPAIVIILALWTTDWVIVSLIPPIQSTFGFNIFLWQYSYGPIYTKFFVFYQSAVFIYGLGLMLHKYFTTRLHDLKMQLIYLSIGIGIPIVIGVPTGIILPSVGIILPPHNNVLTLFMSIFLAVGVLKYKFLTIHPLQEVIDPKIKMSDKLKRDYPLEMSSQYLFAHEKGRDHSYRVLLNQLYKKYYGLIITTKDPDHIKEKFHFQTTPIIWLTDTETDHPSVGPNDISQMYKTITKFVSQVNNSFVLIDGLDYLLEHNNFKKILDLLKEIKLVVEKNNCCLIIPQSDIELDKKKEKLLMKEFTILPAYISAARLGMHRAQHARRAKKTTKYVVLGFNYITESVLSEVSSRDVPCIMIDEKKPPSYVSKICKYVRESPLKRNVLGKAGIDKEGVVVIVALDDDSSTILAINLLREISEKSMIVANIHNDVFVDVALDAGATHVVPALNLGGKLMSLAMKKPELVTWLMDASTFVSESVDLTEFEIVKNSGISGKTVGFVDDLLERYANVVAISTLGGLNELPVEAQVLKTGDTIVLVVNADKLDHDGDLKVGIANLIKKKLKNKIQIKK